MFPPFVPPSEELLCYFTSPHLTLSLFFLSSSSSSSSSFCCESTMRKLPFSPLLPLLLLFAFALVQSRFIGDSQTSGLVSDGSDDASSGNLSFSFLKLPRISTSSNSTCDETYGFLPCTTSALGNTFLILVYGYLMYTGATYLSNGSELLLELLGPGIIGGLFLPILGALPDALLILVSGLSGSTSTAQSQVLIGMGLLAGSTVMLLTVLWGSCVVVGKCDFADGRAKDNQDTKGFDLIGSGITTDSQTSDAAKIMAISVIPFVAVQLPQVFSSSTLTDVAIIISLVLALVFLLAYCLYQVFVPWITNKKIEFAKLKAVRSGILQHLHRRTLGKLCHDSGEPNAEIISKMFHLIDLDGDGQVSLPELRALIIGLHLDNIDLDRSDAADKIMKEFDTSQDNVLDRTEFTHGISKWVRDAKKEHPNVGGTRKFVDTHHSTSVDQVQSLDNGDDECETEIENPRQVYIKAISLLLLGTVIAAIFADPLVDAVDDFSDTTGIPSFFISFIFLPLATNSSEAVTAIIFASRKKQRTASLTFSEIYGAVTMNNLLCLAVFLVIVYARGLSWDFTAEVLIILIVVVVMGVFTSVRTTFPLWTSIIAFLFYPLSLVLVYVFDYVLGWS